MEASEWVTLIVGLLAVIGTLGGVAFGSRLAHRSASDVLRAQLAEERRRELTSLLTDIAVDGHAVTEAAWIEIPSIAGMQLQDLTEYIDTESGRKNAERRQRLNENLTRAVLLVADANLAHRTAQLTQDVRDWPDKIVGPVFKKEVRGRRDMDAITESFQHLNAIRRSLSEFELAAREVLTLDIGAERAKLVIPPKTGSPEVEGPSNM